jgi:hypothetical protein
MGQQFSKTGNKKNPELSADEAAAHQAAMDARCRMLTQGIQAQHDAKKREELKAQGMAKRAAKKRELAAKEEERMKKTKVHRCGHHFCGRSIFIGRMRNFQCGSMASDFVDDPENLVCCECMEAHMKKTKVHRCGHHFCGRMCRSHFNGRMRNFQCGSMASDFVDDPEYLECCECV